MHTHTHISAYWRILIFECKHRQHQNRNGNQSQSQRHRQQHSHRHWQLIFKFISHLWTECVHYQQALCCAGDDNARAEVESGEWEMRARPDCASIRHARCTVRASKSIGDNCTMGPKGNILTADCLPHCPHQRSPSHARLRSCHWA